MKQRILMLSLFFVSMIGVAQPIDWNKRLPADPDLLIGKLPNGITYYLRHNEEPKERASFYIIRKAGAVLEEDNQNGLAHFLEHMAFNGSKNFPENTLQATLERHGISFGGNLNAYTSLNETVYNISDVPTANESLIDTCLLILHDWSYYLTLDPKAIDDERGVIQEEWRSRNSSRTRIFDQQRKVLYKGSRYAERDVIGDMEVIRTFKPETLRDFYHQWYRTDLEAISIVGDFDVQMMEKKIKEVFSTIPAIENPTPRPFTEIPAHEELYYCLATDKEATSNNIQLMRVFRDPAYDGKGYCTYEDIKNGLMISFYNSMVSNRIGEAIQRGQAPYLSASCGFSDMVPGYYIYGVTASAKPNQEKEALTGALTEHRRVYLHGFTENELNRVKTNILTNLVSQLKDKDKTHNDSYINETKSHFLKNEAIIALEDYVAAAKEIIPTITPEEVAAQVKKWWNADNRVIIINGPSEGVTHMTEAEAKAIIEEMENKDVPPYVDNTVDGKLITEEPKAGHIVKVKMMPEFEAEEWTLSNGAKVIYRKADYEKDNVSLMAYSPGGSSLYDDFDLLPAAARLGQMTAAYGLGEYDDITLKKMLTGKRAGCSASISGLYESVTGGAMPKDFETMMQMVYLKFMSPRFDTLAHNVIIERQHVYAKQVKDQPQTMMRDSLNRITTNYNPRVQLFNDEYVDKLTIDRIEKIYRDRICDASDFTFFIVGNVEKETVMEMTEKYIASIPSLYRNEKWIDRKVRMPEGKTLKNIEIPMEVPKATVILRFNKDMEYSIKDHYIASLLGNILMNRYTLTIREEQGGTYGVGVQGSASREPYGNYTLYMTFDCNADKAEELKPLLYVELDKVIKDGVTEEELGNVVKNMLKETEQSKQHNSYWMNTLITYYKTGDNMNDPKNVEELISSITTKDVQKFLKKFMKNVDVVDLIFSPKK